MLGIAKQTYEFVTFDSFEDIRRFMYVDHVWESGNVAVRLLYKGFLYDAVECDDSSIVLEMDVKEWADDAHPATLELTDDEIAGGGDAGIENFIGCVVTTTGQIDRLGQFGWGEFIHGMKMYHHDDMGLREAKRNAHELNEAKLWSEWDVENEER